MANPLNDFSRLHTDLPGRNTIRDLMHARRNALKFLDEIETDQFEWPKKIGDIDPETRFYLSRVIDRSALRVYNEAVRLIQKTPEHKANYKPLESLEYVRQPYFSGATILKANAFEVGIIDNSYRYAVESNNGAPFPLACVELKQQNHPNQALVKEKSAGSNVLFLEKNSPKKRLVKTLNYEDWSDDGYRDEVMTSFKVKEYWRVLKKTVRSRETEKLDNMMRNLFVSRAGPFTSPNVNTFYAEKLFPED
jgi:hypothetical protein